MFSETKIVCFELVLKVGLFNLLLNLEFIEIKYQLFDGPRRPKTLKENIS